MSLWLVRAGRSGEHEQRFFEDSRIYLTWDELQQVDLGNAKTLEDVRKILDEHCPNETHGRLVNWSGQIWTFLVPMKPGDWVVVPRKTKPAVAFGELISLYTYAASAPVPYRHSRTVKWLTQDVPRSAFDQDLLFSFGAFMTVCQIKRNDAERRVRAMAERGWTADNRSQTVVPSAPSTQTGSHESTSPAIPFSDEDSDLEPLARDQIAKLITRRFSGHAMARLVEAVLQTQGYTTFESPAGADKGVDILAAPGPLGFGSPRVCVQVKSQDTPVDRPTLDQLIGTMQNFQAQQGLLVSWGGFKASVDREEAAQFVRVRLWDQDDLLDEVLKHYDELDADLRAELPLKRVWTIARDDEE